MCGTGLIQSSMAVVFAAFAVNSEGSRQWAKQSYELDGVSTRYSWAFEKIKLLRKANLHLVLLKMRVLIPIPKSQANVKGIMYAEILSSNIMRLQREPNMNSKSNKKDYAIVVSYDLLLEAYCFIALIVKFYT